MDVEKTLNNIGLKIPKIVLPHAEIDMQKWAVVACDQHTSDKKYWMEIEKLVSDSPSTLNLIFPECYLEDSDSPNRINKIHKTMKQYIDSGKLYDNKPFLMLVERETGVSDTRFGIMAALDLEKYDFSEGSKSLIRATEGTIVDRLPPRINIRKKAPLELPHIMVLIDDAGKSIIEPIVEKKDTLDVVYDIDLMKNGGHVRGYKIDNSNMLEIIADEFTKLADPLLYEKKYGNKDVLLFAMGDGNHSLATAKAIWEETKKNNDNDPELMDSASRWALVEILNIYDNGIEFEPIHRVIFNTEEKQILDAVSDEESFTLDFYKNLSEIESELKKTDDFHRIGIILLDKYGVISVKNPETTIAAGTIQLFLDKFLKTHPDSSIDYIHGASVTEKLCMTSKNIGFILPPIEKETFFKTVITDGAFPRKTFSMGEASEKRYYIEARKI